jgi:8-oxo-dGTP diphosphatase
MARVLLVVAAALIDSDGRVLIAQRPRAKTMGGLWEFPGGKVNEGETPEAALVRELNEELGIDVEASCLAPISFSSCASADVHLLMPLFACRKWKGLARPLEAEALAWVRPLDLGSYDMPPADRPLAAQLRDMI